VCDWWCLADTGPVGLSGQTLIRSELRWLGLVSRVLARTSGPREVQMFLAASRESRIIKHVRVIMSALPQKGVERNLDGHDVESWTGGS
jgi:hypothetical protein